MGCLRPLLWHLLDQLVTQRQRRKCSSSSVLLLFNVMLHNIDSNIVICAANSRSSEN